MKSVQKIPQSKISHGPPLERIRTGKNVQQMETWLVRHELNKRHAVKNETRRLSHQCGEEAHGRSPNPYRIKREGVHLNYS